MTVPNLDRGKLRLRHPSTAYLNYVWELPFLRRLRTLGTVWADGSGTESVVPERRPLVPVPRPFANPRFNDNGTGTCDPATFDPTKCIIRARTQLEWGANDRPNAIANHVNATHAPSGRRIQIFLRDSLLRLAWAAWANLGAQYFCGAWILGRGYFIFKTFSFPPLRPAIRGEAFNVFQSTNFQLGGATVRRDSQLNNQPFGQASARSIRASCQFGLMLSF